MLRNLLGFWVNGDALVPGGVLSSRQKIMSVEEGAKYINVDADTAGHYLCVLADYHTALDQAIRKQQYVITEEQMTDLYLLGNIEGRLIHNHVTAVDIELIECWENELPSNTCPDGVGEF